MELRNNSNIASENILHVFQFGISTFTAYQSCLRKSNVILDVDNYKKYRNLSNCKSRLSIFKLFRKISQFNTYFHKYSIIESFSFFVTYFIFLYSQLICC